MPVDYHMHTYLSDGKDKHIDFIPHAIENGISEIGFSDHICLHKPKWAMKLEDTELMKNEIEKAKRAAGDKLNIKFGIEMDFIPGKEQEIEDIINSLPLDYVIGSIHYIDQFNFDTDYAGFAKKDINESYEKYYNDIKAMINSGLFDIIAHFDLIKMFGNFKNHHMPELIQNVLILVKKSNMVIELNTNGFNKPCKEFYPSNKILELCYSLQIPITLSSDAHLATQVGQYFDKAIATLKRVGFKSVTGFSKREKYSIWL